MKKDKYVMRLQTRPVGSYRPPKVMYICKYCGFKTFRAGRAWAHSELHGPWDQEASGARAHELKLSAQATIHRLNHPRGIRTAVPLALVAL